MGDSIFDPLGGIAAGSHTLLVLSGKDTRESLAKAGLRSKIGVDSGEVLVFDTPQGRRDIAGMPVNRASKITQDRGEFGKLYLSDSAASEAGSDGFERIEVEVSGVRLESWVYGL